MFGVERVWSVTGSARFDARPVGETTLLDLSCFFAEELVPPPGQSRLKRSGFR
jgi:hypothetical protein